MTKDETERTREEKTTRTRKRKKMMKMITIWKNKTKQNKQTKQQQPQRKFQKSLYCIYPQLYLPAVVMLQNTRTGKGTHDQKAVPWCEHHRRHVHNQITRKDIRQSWTSV